MRWTVGIAMGEAVLLPRWPSAVSRQLCTAAVSRHREIADAVAREMQLQSPSDWKKVDVDDVRRLGGDRELRECANSIYRLLCRAYPEAEWPPEECRKSVPQGYWREQDNRRRFMDRVAAKMDIRKPEDWQRLRRSDLLHMGGSGLLSHYRSVRELLLEVYPEMEEAEVRQMRKRWPRGHWEAAENRRSFMEQVAEANGVERASDWRRVTLEDIKRMGGSGLLHRYGNSVAKLLQDAFPEKDLPEAVTRTRHARGYWKDLGNVRGFLAAVAEEMGVTECGGWARVSVESIRKLGGDGLLREYGSVVDALRKAWPEKYTEEELRHVALGGRKSDAVWQSQEYVREFLDAAKEPLGIRTDADWLRVSWKELRDCSGSGLLRASSLDDALHAAYPNVNWASLKQEMRAKGPGKKSSQRLLLGHLTSLAGS